MLIALGLTALLIVAQALAQRTTWGHRIEVIAFELLQGQLSPFDPAEELPVVVVDISDIKNKDSEVIDLERLTQVITAIAEQKPRAIGVDVVVTPESPSENGSETEPDQKTIDANYFKFLDFCHDTIKTKKGVPIFLAVGQRTVEAPTEWLGDAKYKELAATIIVPREDTNRMPIWFKADADAEKLFSMSASLARASRRVHLPVGLAWAVESADEEFPGTQKKLKENMEYADALANYSKLEAIQQNKLLTISETSVREAAEKFRGRIVILGDATREKAVDTFVVAGRNEPVAGVYLHASAAYTFAREPMYEFKPVVRFLLDLMLSLTAIGWVGIARFRHLGDKRAFNWHKLQKRLALGFLIGAGVLAILLVRITGILWLDFLMVMLAMWIHPKIEERLVKHK